MLIAQISDCHIVEHGDVMADRVDSSIGLRRAVARLNALGDDLDLVIATGVLVNDGRAEQYDRLAELLAPLAAPLLAIPGNHDDRTELRARFDLPDGSPEEPIDHVVELDAVRLVCLDTTIPGRHDGGLSATQLAWLDRVLGADPHRRTVIVQHHPPFPSGIDSMDRYQLDGAAHEAQVVARHPAVAAILAGHYHRPITCGFGGTAAFCLPSTAAQLADRLGPGPTTYVDEAPALALHVIDDSDGTVAPVQTHLLQLTDATSWVPSWADAS